LSLKQAISPYSIAYLVISNAALLGLIWWVFQDYAYRLAYWRSMGFTPTTKYWPFFYVTSAVKGSVYIPGQLTLDWTQVLGVVLIIIDAGFLIGLYRRRARNDLHRTSV
jgi:hypothetical protein